jgi:cell division protein FtsB
MGAAIRLGAALRRNNSMGNRIVPAALIALLVILHGQLWFGRGSVPNVSRLMRQLEEQQQSNANATRFNERLAAEISDLREGLEIVEEKARAELGMVKTNEIYVQIAR